MPNSYSNSFHKLTAFLLVLIFSHNFSVFAQARKTNNAQTAANNTKQTAPKCSGAWTGNVTYTRTQTMTDSKTVKRVSNRGEDKRDWEMRYNYKVSVAVLESPERNGSNTGKARIEHQFSSIDKTIAREENSCDCGKTFRVMFRKFSNENRNDRQRDRRRSERFGRRQRGRHIRGQRRRATNQRQNDRLADLQLQRSMRAERRQKSFDARHRNDR